MSRLTDRVEPHESNDNRTEQSYGGSKIFNGSWELHRSLAMLQWCHSQSSVFITRYKNHTGRVKSPVLVVKAVVNVRPCHLPQISSWALVRGDVPCVDTVGWTLSRIFLSLISGIHFNPWKILENHHGFWNYISFFSSESVKEKCFWGFYKGVIVYDAFRDCCFRAPLFGGLAG